MKAYIVLAEDGLLIAAAGLASSLPDGAIEIERVDLPRVPALAMWNPKTRRIEPRPQMPPPVFDGWTATGEDLPPGAELVAIDPATDMVVARAFAEGGRASLALDQAGALAVEVRGPTPWRASEIRVPPDVLADSRRRSQLRYRSAAAIMEINTAVGRRRKDFVTDIPAQQMLYLEKRAEAQRYLALPIEPRGLADFPLIAAEVGITAATPWQLAQLWLNQSAMLVAVAARLETLRLGTIAAIEAATSVEEIEALVAAFYARKAEGVMP